MNNEFATLIERRDTLEADLQEAVAPETVRQITDEILEIDRQLAPFEVPGGADPDRQAEIAFARYGY